MVLHPGIGRRPTQFRWSRYRRYVQFQNSNFLLIFGNNFVCCRRVTLSLLGFLALAASCHEAWRLCTHRPIDTKREVDSPVLVRYLHCFSVITNGKKLLSTKAPAGNLGCLNGLRKSLHQNACEFNLVNLLF